MSSKITAAFVATFAGHPLAEACERQRVGLALANAALEEKNLALEAKDKAIRDMARDNGRLRRELREARAQQQSGGRIRRHG